MLPFSAHRNIYFDPRVAFDKYNEFMNIKLVSKNHAITPCYYYEYGDFTEALSSVYRREKILVSMKIRSIPANLLKPQREYG